MYTYQLKYKTSVLLANIFEENNCHTLPSFKAGGIFSTNFSGNSFLLTFAAVFKMSLTSSLRGLLRSHRQDSGINLENEAAYCKLVIFRENLFSQIAYHFKNPRLGHNLPTSDYVILQGFYFHEASHPRSFAKIKPSRIYSITYVKSVIKFDS